MEEEAAWLQSLLRSGDLTPDRLELAAHLRHPATLALLGRAPRRVRSLVGWAGKLSEFGPGVEPRSMAALARLELSAWKAPHLGREAAEAAIAAFESWVVDPASRELGELVRDSSLRLIEEARALAPVRRQPLPRVRTKSRSRRKRSLRKRAKLQWAQRRAASLRQLAALVLYACASLCPPEHAAELIALSPSLFKGPERVFGVEAVLSAIRDELTPWLLGTGDPVRARVERRVREARR